jgi:ABC-type antimicrobial peptide transport system permease subunit
MTVLMPTARKVEFATLQARGTSRREVSAILLGEALAILTIAVPIGAAVGLSSAYFATRVFPFAGPESEQVMVPLLFTVPLETLMLLALALLTALAMVTVIAKHMTSLQLGRALKLRMG